jgi:hypothetical protein
MVSGFANFGMLEMTQEEEGIIFGAIIFGAMISRVG